MVSTSPLLSNPNAVSSAGKSSAAWKSGRNSRSRIVFVYSARFSRRSVTRPGSRGPPQSTRVNTSSRAATNPSVAAGTGRGRPFGGISPSRTARRTPPQSSRSAARAPSSWAASRETPPRLFPAPWQPKQCSARKGRTWSRKVGWGRIGRRSVPTGRGRPCRPRPMGRRGRPRPVARDRGNGPDESPSFCSSSGWPRHPYPGPAGECATAIPVRLPRGHLRPRSHLDGISYRPPDTSAAYTCVAPCMFERNTTHLLSGVIVTFGSSA